MADVAQLSRALRAAHEAGDVEAARRLAAAIQREQSRASQTEMTPEQREARIRELLPGVSIDPTEGRSFGQNFAAGLGKSFVDTGRGIGQLVGLVDQSAVDEAAALDAPLMRTGGGITGNVTGQIAQVVVPAGGAVRAGGTVGRIGGAVLNPRSVATASSRAGRATQAMGVGGAVGGTQAALQPVVTGDTRIGNALTGAALGAGGQGVFDLGAAGVQAGRRVLANSTGNADVLAAQALRESIGTAGEQALRQPMTPLVAGSDPTTAEVLRRAGASDAATRAAMLERTVRTDQRFSPDFAQLDEARNAARVASIREGFGGADDAGVAAIETARDRAAARLRARFERDEGVNTQRVLNLADRIVERVGPRRAVAQTVQTARQALVDEAGNPRTDVRSLYQARLDIGDLMRGLNPDAPQANAAMRELIALRSALDNEIRKVSPAFGQYLRQYREASQEAGRVATGRRLLESGRSRPGSDAAVRLMPDSFNQATRDLDRVVQQATNFRRATAERALLPEQLDAIQRLRVDLDNQSWVASQSRASSNSITAEALAQRSAASNQISNLITSGVPLAGIAKAVFSDVSDAQAERVAAIIASALRNPERARQILASVPANQRSRATALVEAVRGSSLVPGAATSTAVGVGTVLNPQPQPLELEVIGDRRIGRTIPVGP